MSAKKSHFIKALKETPNDGRVVTDLFAVVRKNLSMSTRNKPYLRLTLADKSDTIDAFVWEDAEEFSRRFAEGDILAVTFRLRVRNDVPQMHVEDLERLSDKDLEGLRWEDFRPGLDLGSRKQFWAEIREILAEVRHPAVSALLGSFLDDAGFQSAFLDAPAAKGFHHAYVGGLAEHTLAVLRLAAAVGALYATRLNRDLLLAGAFLHDLGKIEELSSRTGDYTDLGRLVGHTVLGVRMLRARTSGLRDLPGGLLLQLEHLILSHHGEREWGAPVQPQTLEALALHHLDNLDAKLAGATEWLARENVGEGSWSSYWKGLGRQLLRTPLLEAASGTEAGPGSFLDIEEEFLRREAGGEGGGSPGEPDTAPGKEGRSGKREKRGPTGQGELGF